LIADGGAKQTGDIAKAIYFGADFVMMGKMLASTDLAAGDCYNYNKEKLVVKDKIDCL
jgi:IMP dehydrogenase